MSAVNAPTPGPWDTAYMESWRGGYAQQIFDANGVLIATAAWYPVRVSDTTTGTNREANARLIAAAPELLEACQTFAEWLRREDAVGGLEQPWRGKRDTPEGEALWQEWFNENLRLCALAQEQAAAAIRKATGAAE